MNVGNLKNEPDRFLLPKLQVFLFSREEPRRHVHIRSPDGEAKFWLEPEIVLAASHGLSSSELKELTGVVEDKADEIRKHWNHHFGT